MRVVHERIPSARFFTEEDALAIDDSAVTGRSGLIVPDSSRAVYPTPYTTRTSAVKVCDLRAARRKKSLLIKMCSWVLLRYILGQGEQGERT